MAEKIVIEQNEQNESQAGQISYAPSVIAKIAALSIKGIDGIYDMASSISDGVKGFFSGAQPVEKGISVFSDDKGAVTVDIAIIGKYGSNLREIASDAQETIKRTVESMTGISVAAVNVSVTGIAMPADNAAPEQGEGQ